MSLVLEIMAAYGFDFAVSDAMVHRFFNVTYDPAKAAECVDEPAERLARATPPGAE